MPITNTVTGTRIDEIARDVYRISTPVPKSPELPPGFSFNQFLIRAEAPLLFHTGSRRLFPLVREAVATVLAPASLRYVGFSHVEGDECGSLDEWLELAPKAVPLCSRVAAMVYANEASDRPVRALGDGDQLDLGGHVVTWFDTPHLPHGWECGYLGERTTATLFCGDLFTQPGSDNPPVTEDDIIGPSEVMRGFMDYYAHGRDTVAKFERLAAFEPRLLACMHGSAFRGDGARALRELGSAVVS
jgi:flavorubredoxin